MPCRTTQWRECNGCSCSRSGGPGVLVLDDDRSDQRPGVLVIHGGAGLDDHAREQAHRYAELGCVAFACDMYGRGVAGDRESRAVAASPPDSGAAWGEQVKPATAGRPAQRCTYAPLRELGQLALLVLLML